MDIRSQQKAKKCAKLRHTIKQLLKHARNISLSSHITKSRSMARDTLSAAAAVAHKTANILNLDESATPKINYRSRLN